MDWSAHNANYVLAAYIISGLCLCALVGAIVLIDKRNARSLRMLKE